MGPIAHGATADYQLEIGGDRRTAAVDVLDKNGVEYVPLSNVVEKFGGGSTMRASRVQVDLAGSTAWIGINMSGVEAAATQFQLQHPLLRDGDTILMALVDVVPFFTRAFRLKVVLDRGGTGGQPQQGPVESAPPAGGRERARVPEPLADLGQTIVPATPNAVDVIVIDPGHGGSDTGCVGFQGLEEKTVTLAIARKLQEILVDALGCTVKLTRSEDLDLPDKVRCNHANRHRGDLFISIHAGASYTSDARGFETFHLPVSAQRRAPLRSARTPDASARLRRYAAEGRKLALDISQGLDENVDTPNRGVREAPCRVLRGVAMPGVLVEIGCLTSSVDEAALSSPAHREMIAEGIGAGVVRYLDSPARAGTEP